MCSAILRLGIVNAEWFLSNVLVVEADQNRLKRMENLALNRVRPEVPKKNACCTETCSFDFIFYKSESGEGKTRILVGLSCVLVAAMLKCAGLR